MPEFSCEEILPQGEKYPIETDCYAPTGEDRNSCDQRLRKESQRLFQIAGGGVDVLCSSQDEESHNLLLQQCFITSEEVENYGVSQHLRGESWRNLIFIIQPAFSWSQLSTTELAFRNILASLRVFTPFLHIVHAFGAKINDKKRWCDLTYCRIQPSSAYEFCYNIRYFEENGRARGNPWSLRQTGAYQRCFSSGRSAWLLLNFSSYINERVIASLKAGVNSTGESCEASSLLPHLFILSAAAMNWEAYIEYLRQKVMTLEEKAYSSHVDQNLLDDYELLFSDVQKIMLLGDSIAVAETVIQGQRDVLSQCSDLHAKLDVRVSWRHSCDTSSTIKMLKASLQNYHEATTDLARIVSKATQLLSAILATRASDNLRATMTSIQTCITEVQLQSKQAGLNTEQLLRVTTQGRKDSATNKILAQVAAMFLPASFVASLFNSSIFIKPGNNDSYATLYVAITIPLSLVTLLVLIFLERHASRDAEPRRLI